MDRTWQSVCSMAETVIGRGTWIDKLAAELLDRERNLGRSLDHVVVESGLGASGVPHVGSLGDAVRSYGVKLALENMGCSSTLIAYSDDLDGLRKVPEGFPGSLEQDVGKPVSLIDDPFGSYESYGSHMSGILLDGLDRLGVQYEFRRAYDTYRDGLLSEQAHAILSRADRIGEAILDMVGQDKYTKSLPYFAVCANCQRIYTTQSHRYDPQSRTVSYSCGDATIGGRKIRGCGHTGSARIGGGDLGKLAWKVEFAARWSAFDVRFEAYGKDIMDSVQVNDWVAQEILGTPPPHHVRYEMFLDSGGKKISKSLGNVVTAQDWLKIGSPQSLLLLLYKRIKGARHLGLGDVPSLMNEYNELEDVYFGRVSMDNKERESRLRGLYEYANLLRPPAEPAIHVNYLLLVELAGIFREDRGRRITQKLMDYGIISEASPDLDRLIELAGRFADDHAGTERPAVEIDGASGRALTHLAASLRANPGANPQDLVYEAAKSGQVRPRDFFRVLYRIMLGTDRGPRLGPLISDMGFENVAVRLDGYAEG